MTEGFESNLSLKIPCSHKSKKITNKMRKKKQKKNFFSTFDEVLIREIHKELLRPNNRKTNNPTEMGKRFQQIFIRR